MRIQLAPHLEALTEKIVGAGVAVSKALGRGFLEAVYRRAMLIELPAFGLSGEAEKHFDIRYRGQFIGHYVADLIVEGTVIVELKAVEALSQAHVGQVVNYLRASSLPVGLLLNFGRPRLEIRRILP